MKRENVFAPYSTDAVGMGCSCGAHATQAEHLQDQEQVSLDFIEAAAVRALLPHEPTRRRFLKAVGVGAAMAAISQIMPFGSLHAMAEERGPLERKSLKVGFIPITCATPLIMADPMGYYREQGLDVSLQKTAGWALVRDHMLNGELDASHFLAPMPLAITLGLGSNAQPMRAAAMQNINGQAITLALKHANNRDPRNWKGFKFAIPFEFSMHNFLLRYYLAEHGLDPDRDVQLRVTPPAEMIANLRAGNIDGFLGPDPFNQRAVYDEVGFIHVLSKDIWDGHPCCAFGTSQAFIEENPNTFAALYRAILKSSHAASDPSNLPDISKAISTPNYLNQPEIVVRQALTGRFADGLGVVQDQPRRAGFDSMPWYSMATWMLVQMKRWGYIKPDINYHALAEKVFLLTDARREMANLGMEEASASPNDGYKAFSILGKTYDAKNDQAYLDGFPIKRS